MPGFVIAPGALALGYERCASRCAARLWICIFFYIASFRTTGNTNMNAAPFPSSLSTLMDV